MIRHRLTAWPALLLALLIGCTPVASAQVVRSALPRNTKPQVAPSDAAQLVEGQTALALDLYRSLAEGQGNLFFSPYSVATALAMTYAGARGETAAQMADALHFSLPQEQLHPAFNALDLALTGPQANAERSEGTGFELHVANALWGQSGYDFLPDFLDVLALNYDAGIRLVDYVNAADDARRTINAWVAEQTNDKIRDLIPKGALDDLTRLVLTNAIYFDAAWQHPFPERSTEPAPFFLPDGTEIVVPTMRQTEHLLFAHYDDYAAVELPYVGHRLVMDIIMPTSGEFGAFEGSLTPERLDGILAAQASGRVQLALPKFTFSSEFSLARTLRTLGMTDAFEYGVADFSGMDGTRELFIGDVIHKAYVDVNEAGTVAAAATAVIMPGSAMPTEPVEVTIDHPFLFLIRDRETGVILFMGRVVDPR